MTAFKTSKESFIIFISSLKKQVVLQLYYINLWGTYLLYEQFNDIFCLV